MVIDKAIKYEWEYQNYCAGRGTVYQNSPYLACIVEGAVAKR